MNFHEATTDKEALLALSEQILSSTLGISPESNLGQACLIHANTIADEATRRNTTTTSVAESYRPTLTNTCNAQLNFLEFLRGALRDL